MSLVLTLCTTNGEVRLMNGSTSGLLKEELKCVLMESGGQCVTVVGIEEKLKLFVNNWDTTLLVSEHKKHYMPVTCYRF